MLFRILLSGSLALLLVSCQHSRIDPSSNLVVKQVQIPDDMPWYSQFAVHSYIEYQPTPDQSWRRIEIINETSGIRHYEITDKELHSPSRWGESVHIVAQKKENGPKLANEIASFARSYPDANRYVAWPGPNSNTFAEKLLRQTRASGHLDHNAVGKDYGWYLGRTAGGTGLEVQSPYFGLAAGMTEGIELHFIGLTAGVGIWPPAIKLPFISRLPPRASMGEKASLPE
ncbi:DUF3750 domain-containing protein [Roseibacillus persicicus]|uniref:DUF3750 domain-containing protein n=1 Tax=Roseibacillus persicicus TaxID=454148 RepID=UPI0016745DC8|nr:DUF3750 domain-containing protein [Roseibacillus persicicus]